MGLLKLQCATPDAAGTALYALAYGASYLRVVKEKPDLGYDRVILIKSNTSPATALDIVWSVVSTFRLDMLFTLSGAKPTCAVDDQGVFTAISFLSSATPQLPPGGFRYDPGTPTPPALAGVTTGPGTWSNISFATAYGWDNDIQSSALFSLKTSTGANQLVHALAGGSKGGISFGTLGAKGSSFQFTPSTTWPAGGLTDLATAKVAFADNTLYYLGSMLTSPTLTTFPFTAITTTQPTAGVKSISAQGASGCTPAGLGSITVASGTRFYYQCAVQGIPNSMLLYSYDSASSTSGVFMYNPPAAVQVFAPLPKLSQPFIFIQTEDTYGLVLSGNNTISQFPGAPVFVQDTIGTELAEAIPAPDPGDNKRESPGLPASSMVGVGVLGGTLFIVFCLIYCWCANRRNKRRNRQRMEQDGHANTFHHVPEIVPISPEVPLDGAGMSGTHKMVYTVPELKGYTEEPDMVQHQQQQQQPHELGYHPRPNVATTVGEDSKRR
ncbi:hypothetical protein BGZ75_001889 [Mortierella antarctica]|nr:hypothetical protein BGZ67_008643 [Mortierella alpina]KAF9990407.1 hypothetical protein BGZ75_001889 [Mortierella antarctica]